MAQPRPAIRDGRRKGSRRSVRLLDVVQHILDKSCDVHSNPPFMVSMSRTPD